MRELATTGYNIDNKCVAAAQLSLAYGGLAGVVPLVIAAVDHTQAVILEILFDGMMVGQPLSDAPSALIARHLDCHQEWYHFAHPTTARRTHHTKGGQISGWSVHTCPYIVLCDARVLETSRRSAFSSNFFFTWHLRFRRLLLCSCHLSQLQVPLRKDGPHMHHPLMHWH